MIIAIDKTTKRFFEVEDFQITTFKTYVKLKNVEEVKNSIDYKFIELKEVSIADL